MALELLRDKRATGCQTTITDGLYGLKRTDVEIRDEQIAQMIGKPVGRYYTIEIETPYKRAPQIRDYAAEAVAAALSDALNNGQVKECHSERSEESPPIQRTGIDGKTDHCPLSIDRYPLNKSPVLVACLGNRSMSADALGPFTMEKLIVTRHLTNAASETAKKPETEKRGFGNLCALAPGVLGITGIETFDVLAALVRQIRPRAVIAADTLASNGTGRLASAFQIADSGITPGAGVGNRRLRLSRETLGVPVIAIGVPLVVYASTIAGEVLSEAFNGRQRKSRAAAERSAVRLLGDTVVTLKDIDIAVKDCAYILALAINMAVHGLTAREAAGLMSY
ncbi:germination protease [Clostridia bacterium]|nr:germination protease [Clostridia bacterium]